MTTAKDAAKTIEATVVDTQKKVVAQTEAFAADAQKMVADNVDKAAKSLETVATFSQETLDALLKSQNVAAKAAEEIQAEVLAFSKKTVEEGVAHAKDLATAQTLNVFIEKQFGFAKVSFDAATRQTAKMNELVIAASKEIFAPLTSRITAAAESVKSVKA